MGIDKKQVSAVYSEFTPIAIKHGPLPDTHSANSLTRLESMLTQEVSAWEAEQAYPFSEQSLRPMKTALDMVRQIATATSEDEVRNLLSAINAQLSQMECISHSSRLFGFLSKLNKVSPGVFNQVYNAVFRNIDMSYFSDPNVRQQALLAFAIVTSEQPSVPSKQVTDDLDATLLRQSEAFLAAQHSYEAARIEILADWKTTKEETKKLLDSASEEAKRTVESAASDFATAKDTYEKLLSLDSPMGYWKATERRARKSTLIWSLVAGGLIVLLVLAAIWAYESVPVVNIEPNKPFSASDLVKWFVVSSLLVSVLVFGLRQATKVAFSSLHLARDANERRTLAYLFLTLNRKGQATDIEERKIILGALFSRAETGLLKGDSTPMIPNSSLLDKLLGK